MSNRDETILQYIYIYIYIYTYIYSYINILQYLAITAIQNNKAKTGPEEAICEWSGQNFTQYSCTNERILLEIVTQLQCAKHTPKCEA